MKKSIILGILIIIATLMAVNVSALIPGCGGAVPCVCGDSLTSSRTLTAADNLTGCIGNGLTINIAGLTLNCNGELINGSGANVGVTINADSTTITGCTITNFQTGIYVADTSGHTITSNTIIANGIFAPAPPSGIHLDNVNDSTISNNNLSNNDYGVHMTDSNSNTFEENIVNWNWYQAYYLNNCHDNTIDGGEVRHSNQHGSGDGIGGVFLTASDRNTIADLDMNDNTGGAIYMSASDNNIIELNNIYDNCGLERQIYITNCYGTLIQNNDIVDGTGNGIEIFSSDYVRILNNNILRNGQFGIGISTGGEPTSDHVIRGNTINDNIAPGIYLSGEDNVTIDDNTIRNNAYGVYLTNSIFNFITSNTIENNTEDGISMDPNSYNNTINSNRVCYNLGGGEPQPDTDIHNDGNDNTGDGNTCDTVSNWNDDGTTNCTRVCSWRPAATTGGGGKPYEQDIEGDIGSGDSFTTHRGTNMKFHYDGYEYIMEVDKYTAHYETITITIGRKTYEIKLGETLHIDLDGDGQPDISVTYEGVNPNSVPAEVILKVEPYTQGTTSSQPVALQIEEEVVDGQPIIVVKVSEPKVEHVVMIDDAPSDKLLKSIKVRRLTPTLDTGRIAGGITILAISILGVLGMGYFFTRKKQKP